MGLPKKKLINIQTSSELCHNICSRWNNFLPEFRTEDKVEKAAEGSEDDDKFHHEGREAHETKLDSGCNLFKGLLETKMKNFLVEDLWGD